MSASPLAQLSDADVERGERGGAGGVDGEIRAAQIEAIGDAPGDDIAEESRKGVLRPLRQLILIERLQDLLARVLGDAFGLRQIMREQRPEDVDRSEIIHAARGKNCRGALARERPAIQAGVFQRHARHQQREELHGFDGAQTGGRNPITRRVKSDVVEEAAPLRIDLVLHAAFWVVEVGRAPAILGHLAN